MWHCSLRPNVLHVCVCVPVFVWVFPFFFFVFISSSVASFHVMKLDA